MYGSYGSYSSMSALSAPMDITSNNLNAHDRSCAFPSWPRRSSLSTPDNELPATSYLSDDDLFFTEISDDDARSISSADSTGTASPDVTTDAELLVAIERDRVTAQLDYVRQLMYEKEKRRQATRKRRSTSGTPRKSPKSKTGSMAPIPELVE